jgi:putative hemolysin
MMLPALILIVFFLLLSAFFSSSETALIASNPYKINYLEKKGNKKAKLVRKMTANVDNFLPAILIGNTLVNAAAASLATYVFVSFLPDKNQAVLYATVVTTFLILIFSEITPKTYAANNPIKVSLLYIQPLRFFVLVFFPLVKAVTGFFRLISSPSEKKEFGMIRTLNEEEIRIMLSMGTKKMSSLRKKMISGILDIGSRPIREITIPISQLKAIEINMSLKKLLRLIQSEGHSRYPVYSEQLDNIRGVIHVKDIIPYFVESKDFNITKLIRPPLFVAETASQEKVLHIMQKKTKHLVFVVDELGNMKGIVTMEDILEEIVGEIRDEYDSEVEESIFQLKKNTFMVKGQTSIKELNQRLSLDIPSKGEEYTTLAGFLLNEFRSIPQNGDTLYYKNHKFVVEKMLKRLIALIRIEVVHKKLDDGGHIS